jgi:c-di-GMP-binding flagellar brake protein YcgR
MPEPETTPSLSFANTPISTVSRLELEEADIYGEYFLYSPTEMVFILREAMQKGCMMTVYFDMGRSFFLSTLLSVELQGIVLDCSSHDETNRRALGAKRLICTLSVDRVKVQFALGGLSRNIHENRPAFFSPLPESLLRLQRREHFRIPTPVVNPLKCEIFLPSVDPQAPDESFVFPLLDISVGGLGLRVMRECIHIFNHDAVFPDCVLTLPESGPVKVGLRVRTVLEINSRASLSHFRAGCEFVTNSRSLPTIIQRYIIALERERKARAVGLE